MGTLVQIISLNSKVSLPGPFSQPKAFFRIGQVHRKKRPERTGPRVHWAFNSLLSFTGSFSTGGFLPSGFNFGQLAGSQNPDVSSLFGFNFLFLLGFRTYF